MILPGFPRFLPSSGGKAFADYNAFLAHITAFGFPAGTATTEFGSVGTSTILMSAGTPSGSVYGSVWGSHVGGGSRVLQALQHGFPSQSSYQQQNTNSAKYIVSCVSLGLKPSFPSLTRNGYTSSSYPSEGEGYGVDRIIYWDFSEDDAFEINPSTMSAPIQYTGD